MITYKLIRSRRKTVAIHITKNAEIEVRAPLKLSKIDIDRFISSKEKWIDKYLSKREQINETKSVYTLNYGDMITFRGYTYPIHAQNGKYIGFDGDCFYMPPGLTLNEIKQAAIQIYKHEAKRIITIKVAEYAKFMNVVPTAVKITSAKTRWGSCSGKNSINFSWRLIMADDDVIDYVVTHELAHITEHNHSPRFWALVGKVMPDYKIRKNKLRLLQEKLIIQDWD